MSTELKIGDPAPDFQATAVGGIYGTGQKVKLTDFAGSPLVLYFYPKDNTPGCTAQACEMRDSWRELQSKAELFGVSVDSTESHLQFIREHRLPFPLLSDPDRAIVDAYQVWVEKSMYGKKYMGTERTTYIIGPDQKIKAILRKVKSTGHVAQVIQALASVL
jgi:peroxiredoxin Q/BCP